MSTVTMLLGGRYNWIGQPERLVYLGCKWSGNGYWHQFALVDKLDEVWCEVRDTELPLFEETYEPGAPPPKWTAADVERERLAFERLHPMPPNCIWLGYRYAPATLSAWAAQSYADQFQGWLRRAKQEQEAV